jgi:hypothetical protein
MQQILEMADSDPREYLRRGEIVNRIRKKYGENG